MSVIIQVDYLINMKQQNQIKPCKERAGKLKSAQVLIRAPQNER